MARLAAAIVGLAFAVAGTTGPAAAQQRELGAHEHGRGTLNIALEGSRLTMELEAPGVDIVGFEHKAKSAKDKAVVANAKKQLAKPLALFKLPAAAGCVVKQADSEARGRGRSRARPWPQSRQGQGRQAAGRQGREGRPRPLAVPCRVRTRLQEPRRHHGHRVRLLRCICRRAEARGERHHAERAEQVRGDPRQAAARSRRHDVMWQASSRRCRKQCPPMPRRISCASPTSASRGRAAAPSRSRSTSSPCRRASACC